MYVATCKLATPNKRELIEISRGATFWVISTYILFLGNCQIFPNIFFPDKNFS